MDDRQHIAVHEAGHAVIGRVLGMVCGPVSILIDDDSAGHSMTADPWLILGEWERRGRFREMKTVFHGRILTYMAGAEAEIALVGQCRGGDGDDRLQIAMMLEEVAGDDSDRVGKRLRRGAAALCVRHAAKIQRVADKLSIKDHIDDDAEIRRVAGLPMPPSTGPFALAAPVDPAEVVMRFVAPTKGSSHD